MDSLVSPAQLQGDVSPANVPAPRITIVYYLDEKTGGLATKRINAWLAPYYRSKICRRRRAVCPGCGMKYLVLAKNDKQIFDIKCPGCEDGTTLIPSRLQNRVTDFT